MKNIIKVTIAPKTLEYLLSRNLEKQYHKAKEYILEGKGKNVDLKLREPKIHQLWYFRINKQYRALCKMNGNTLEVYGIDNHQN